MLAAAIQDMNSVDSVDSMLERHYTVKELADMWHLDQSTVRRWFIDEPGILRSGSSRLRTKRCYTSLRIPESVARRVYRARKDGK